MVKKIHASEHGGPAKAKSSYMLYSDTVRAKVIADMKAECEKTGEKFAITATGKKIGEMWKTLSEDDKKVFAEQAVKEKAEYETKMKAWQLTKEYQEFVRLSANNKQKNEMKDVAKKAKESGMPVRPGAGYFNFSVEQMPGVIAQLKAEGKKTEMSVRAAMIKEKWNALGDEGQAPYLAAAKEAKAKYDVDIAAWNQTEEGKAFLATKKKAAEKSAATKKAGRAAASALKKAGKRASKDTNGPSPKRRRVSAAASSNAAAPLDSTTAEENDEAPASSADDGAVEEAAEVVA